MAQLWFNYFLNNGVVTISFDNMDELEKKILGTYTGTDGTTYSAIIKVSNEESNIYKVEATVKDNEKGHEVDKKIYISR